MLEVCVRSVPWSGVICLKNDCVSVWSSIKWSPKWEKAGYWGQKPPNPPCPVFHWEWEFDMRNLNLAEVWISLWNLNVSHIFVPFVTLWYLLSHGFLKNYFNELLSHCMNDMGEILNCSYFLFGNKALLYVHVSEKERFKTIRQLYVDIPKVFWNMRWQTRTSNFQGNIYFTTLGVWIFIMKYLLSAKNYDFFI